MLRALVPPEVVVVETSRPSAWDAEPAAGDGMLRAARLRDFRVGRACARRALRGLSESASVTRGPDGEPVWPSGISGSITHCLDYAAAAVARTEHVPGVGIDVERNVVLPARVVERIATPSERAWLRAARSDASTNWPAVLFSAKESIYKALFPLLRRHLGFLDVTLHIDLLRSTFVATVDDLPLHGRVAATATHVFTAAVVQRSSKTDAGGPYP